MKAAVTIAAIQSKALPEPSANLKKAEKMIRQAAARGAQIICLQELYRTVYFPQYKKTEVCSFAETIPGESTDTFGKLAKDLGVVIIVPLFEKAKNGKYYNAAVVMDRDGTLLPTYRKIHIPQDPLFYEQGYFAYGDSGYRVYKTRFAAFAVL